MKSYMLRTLRAVKWFVVGALSMFGLFTSVVAIDYGKKLIEKREKKEEDIECGFKIYPSQYKRTNNIELGFH